MRGRSHRKIEQTGVKRKITDRQGTPAIYLPKSLLELGLKLNQEVIVLVNSQPNLLNWEIKILPLPKPKETEDDN